MEGWGLEPGVSWASALLGGVNTLSGPGQVPSCWSRSPEGQVQAGSIPFKCMFSALPAPVPLPQQCWSKRCLCGLSAGLGGLAADRGQGCFWLATCVSAASCCRHPTQSLLWVWAALSLTAGPSPHREASGTGAVAWLRLWETSSCWSSPHSTLHGSKPACTLLTVEPRLPTALPSVHGPSNQHSSSLCQTPGPGRLICGWTAHSPGQISAPVISLFLWVPSLGHSSWPDHFSSYPIPCGSFL